MAFSSLKLASYSHSPVVPRSHFGRRDSCTIPVPSFSTGEHRLLQNKRNNNIVTAMAKKDDEISRRETLSLMTGTLLLTSIVPANPASARLSRPEMRRKIMKKLDELREKAGWKKKIEKDEPKLEKNESKIEKKEEKKETNVAQKEANPVETFVF